MLKCNEIHNFALLSCKLNFKFCKTYRVESILPVEVTEETMFNAPQLKNWLVYCINIQLLKKTAS